MGTRPQRLPAGAEPGGRHRHLDRQLVEPCMRIATAQPGDLDLALALGERGDHEAERLPGATENGSQ